MSINRLPPERPDTQADLNALVRLGDQIPGGFFLYRADETQEILYANRAMLRIFGCQTAQEFRELTGNTFPGIVYPEDLDAVQSSIDRQIADASNENLDHVEYRIVRKDGQIRWVDDYGHFARTPDFGGVYYVFLGDITEQRQAREEAMRIKLALGQEKRENEIRSEFLFHLSHDIRTPMNAIIGFSQLARKHLGHPEKVAEDLEKVDAASRQLLSLIDDMLEMNKLNHGHLDLKPEPEHLRRQIRMVLDLFRIPAEEKKLTLAEDLDLPDDSVMIDGHCFRRILGNLVSNAVKFTPEGGTVTVSARQTQISETGFARFEFAVADTGVGIAEEFLPRIFEVFQQEASSTKTGSHGTGLGLSIVKSLLDAMGGTVTVASKKGEGSVFTVHLPLKLSKHEPEPQAEPLPTPQGTGRRILLVEDMEINRLLAETILQESGFQVVSVPDGCDAVDAVSRSPERYFDLVLMDIQMPVMNGYEAARAIRALRRQDVRDLPILALSANAREEDRRASLESGMNDHIAKPFQPAMLVQTVSDYIAARPEPEQA